MKKLLLSIWFLFAINVLFAQETIISGTVSDSMGPLPDVSIVVKGTEKGTTTDFDGNYSIKAKIGDVLEFTHVSHTTVSKSIGASSKIDVMLEEGGNMLSEVVITSQGIKKEKKALGYAISKVGSEEIKNKAESDVARSLQGKVAGVQITASSGSTGDTPNIRIRSSLSINQSNSPLIIVNNVPFSGSLIDIDPNDIKEMSILKGLNASVLYGSEGRNGVIIIQTKSGSTKVGEKKVSINLSQTTYFNNVSNLPDYQNKYGQGSDGVFVGGNVGTWGPSFSELDLVPHPYASQGATFPEYDGLMIPYKSYENNIKDFFKTGIGSITSVNINSVQEKTSFNFSVGYTDEEGIIGNNDMKRFNLGLGGFTQISKKLNLGATLNYSTRKRNYQNGKDIFDRLLYIPRNIDIHNLPYQNPQTGANVYYRGSMNPLWLINNTGRNDDVVRVFGSVNTNYKINKNIGLTYRIGYDSETKDEFDYSNKGGLDDYRLGYLEMGYDKDVIVDQSLILNFNYELTDKINFDSQIGLNSKYSTYKTNYTAYEDQIVYNFLRPSNYRNILPDDDFRNTRERKNLAGAFGQFEFSYDRYLYLTFSGRNDWGSTVEKENRQIFYPGVSFSFIPTSAYDFNSENINFIKIRGAYATSSGYPSLYGTRAVLDSNPQAFILEDGTSVITNGVSNSLPNPNLKPELHKEYEVGLESKFFKNKVNFEASFFKRISNDQIVRRGLDAATGYTSTLTNIGRIDTKGVELDLGIDLYKTEKFRWNFRNIFTSYASEIIELADDELKLGGRNYAIKGQPLGVQKGDYAMRDINGNFLIDPETGKIIRSDQLGLDDRVIANPTPDWTLTTLNSFSYKGFTLSTQLEYNKGGETYSYYARSLLVRGVTKDTENREGSFVIPGVYGDPSTGLPLYDANGNTIPNNVQLDGNRVAFNSYYKSDDNTVFDKSVFRIRDISLSYKLDKKKVPKLPFNNITINISGRNIFYKAPGFPKYTNIDPELDTSYSTTIPTTKRYALGIAVTF